MALGDGRTNKVFKGGATYIVAMVLQMVGGFLVVPLIIRQLTAAEFGSVAIVLLLGQVMTLVVGLGFPAGITRMQYADDGSRVDAASLVLVAAVGAAGLAAISDVAAHLWVDDVAGIPYGPALRLAIWVAVPASILNCAQAVLRAQERALAFSMVGLVSTVGSQLAGLALLAIGPTDAVRYLIGYTAGNAAAAVLGLVLAGIRLRRTSLATIRTCVAIGGPTVPHTLGVMALAIGDRVVIERYLGADDVGRYQIAYLIGGLAAVWLQAVNNIWSPVVYGSPPHRRWQVLATTTSALEYVCAGLVAALSVLAPIVLTIVVPGSYEPEGLMPVVILVAAAALFQIELASRTKVIFQHKRTTVLAAITPVSAAINIFGNILLVPRFGLGAAALMTLITYALQAGVVHQAGRRMAHVPWNLVSLTRSFLLASAGIVLGILLPVGGPGVAARVMAGAVFGVLALRGLLVSLAMFQETQAAGGEGATPEPQVTARG